MLDNISTAYGLWGGLLALLALQFFWVHFVAYPAGFERMLRRGRSWVYIPLAWKGFHKIQVLFVSRLLVAGITALSAVLLAHYYTGRREGWWIAGFVLIAYFAASWLHNFWNTFRYRQQEDAYYLQLDDLRAKHEQENKDYTDAQLRSLSAYQHQQRLRKADEEGRFLGTLRKAKTAVAPIPEA